MLRMGPSRYGAATLFWERAAYQSEAEQMNEQY